jgi:uncharacterized protein involved in response to NO
MPSNSGFALWNLGFRPLYLLAGAFAAISVACWAAQFTGWLGAHSYLRGPLWHAHEMIFGFAFAVIVGFLFTAVRNWTNQPTPTGRMLAAIVVLWLAARLLAPVPEPWSWLSALADLAFALAAAWGIAVPLYASGSRRNYFFVALLVGLGLANLIFHLAMGGVVDLPVERGLQAALDMVLFIMVVMGGRVIPMFTANGVPGAQPRRFSWLERAALGSVLALLACDVLAAPKAFIAAVAVFAALAHGTRLALWQPWRTGGKSIVWILHASYAWIVIHLLLRALASADAVAASAATHALTVGAIGGLTLGMMTRTARGHTGRPLEAGRAETAAYVLVQLAAAVRVLLPIAAPGSYLWSVTVSGLLWAAAFGLFIWRFAPWLWQPRADGRLG